MSRAAGQVVKHRSGLSLIQEATTLRRDRGGTFDDPLTGTSAEIKDFVTSKIKVNLSISLHAAVSLAHPFNYRKFRSQEKKCPSKGQHWYFNSLTVQEIL